MRDKVLSGNGVPSADVFADVEGTPIYIDLATGLAYFLDENNIVTVLSGGSGGSGYPIVLGHAGI